MLLRMPVIGQVILFAIIERFCRLLAAMMQAGVPLPEAMNVLGDATNNVVFRQGIADVHAAMMRGEGLARPLAETKLFPGAITQMIKVGENTGTLNEQLTVGSDFYGQELEYKIAAPHRAVRAGGDRVHGRRGRVRRHRHDLGDVRHLPAGAVLMHGSRLHLGDEGRDVSRHCALCQIARCPTLWQWRGGNMHRMIERAREEGGFTLIELMIVIVILGILAGIVLFAVGGITDRGTTAACKTDVSTIQTGVEAYYAKKGRTRPHLVPTPDGPRVATTSS